MGIPRGSARLLLEEHKRQPFGGTVLQFGRSTVYFTHEELRAWAGAHGVTLRDVETRLSHDPRLAAEQCIDDHTLFESLGFDRVTSSDIEEWEGADYIFDLNESVPEDLEGQFDVVFETGTSVQIFHLPNVLTNIYKLLKPGGRVVHAAVPSNNHMDLGFYMLCPTFFSDYYAANGWQIDSHYLCEYYAYWYRGRLYSDTWDIYQYEPGCLDGLSYGRYGGKQAATFLVATKADEATSGVNPFLGQYRQTWQEFSESGGEGAAGLKQDDVARQSEPGGALGRVAKRMAETVRRRFLPRPMPRRVARY
ncbi:MAG: hypothetical protein AAGA81_04585 [Acidobacteriota bacterium]